MTVTLPAACPALGWGRESGLQCWADRLTEYGVDRCNRRPTRFSDIGLCNRHARLLLGHTSPSVAENPAGPGPVSARLRAGISTPFEVDPGSVSTAAPAAGGTDGKPGSATSPPQGWRTTGRPHKPTFPGSTPGPASITNNRNAPAAARTSAGA